MAFLEPKVTAALSQRGGDTVLTVMCDGPGAVTQFSWNLANAVPDGYMALAQHIGEAALHLLQRAHSDAFAPYPTLVPPVPVEDTLMMAYTLIHRSVREKTLAYVDAIDALVASGDPQVAASDIAANWAEIRSGLVGPRGSQ